MQYGLQSDKLDMTSPVTATLNDFDATNRQLIVGAAGLVPNTTYYYWIQATNTVGTANSGVLSVTTLPARELCTHKINVYTFYVRCTCIGQCMYPDHSLYASSERGSGVIHRFFGPVEPLLQCENT